jgi:hypothetical protein
MSSTHSNSKVKMSLDQSGRSPQQANVVPPTPAIVADLDTVSATSTRRKRNATVLATVAFTDALSRSDAEISAILAKHRVEQTAVSGRLAIAVVSGKIGTLEKLQTALKLNGTANVIIEYPGMGLLSSVE